ncbi:ATP-binding protein [Aureimonas sp. ME7]|uniref:ATP-binding protein n=1 Tax=Aureimonas sp. ME7 TaxID=2744252 RepID=UPI0015F67532|nr:ATP-binding protein [Aureimonas sp. ME7]
MKNEAKAHDVLARLQAGQTPERMDRARMTSSVWRGFFPLARDANLKAEMEQLVDACLLNMAEAETKGMPAIGRLGEGRMLGVIGPSGSGKTRSLHRCFSNMPEFEGYLNADGGSVLVSIVAPSPCTLKLLGQTLLRKLGYDSTRDIKENVVWSMLRQLLPTRGVRFIHIDEVQHLFTNKSENEIQKVRDTLKGLMQAPDWPVWLVLSGLLEVADVIERDRQIRRRCHFVEFKALTLSNDRDDVLGIFKQYANRGGVRIRRMPGDEFFLRLLHASGGAAGTTIELVQDAVLEAARAGVEEVGTAHFASVYARRSGCSDQRNVFVVDDWRSLDVMGVSAAAMKEDDAEAKKPRDTRNA